MLPVPRQHKHLVLLHIPEGQTIHMRPRHIAHPHLRGNMRKPRRRAELPSRSYIERRARRTPAHFLDRLAQLVPSLHVPRTHDEQAKRRVLLFHEPHRGMQCEDLAFLVRQPDDGDGEGFFHGRAGADVRRRGGRVGQAGEHVARGGQGDALDGGAGPCGGAEDFQRAVDGGVVHCFLPRLAFLFHLRDVDVEGGGAGDVDDVVDALDGGCEGIGEREVGDDGEGDVGEEGLDGRGGADLGFLRGVAEDNAGGVAGAEGDNEGFEADEAGCASDEDKRFGHCVGEG